jgi:hypothetical protein
MTKKNPYKPVTADEIVRALDEYWRETKFISTPSGAPLSPDAALFDDPTITIRRAVLDAANEPVAPPRPVPHEAARELGEKFKLALTEVKNPLTEIANPLIETKNPLIEIETDGVTMMMLNDFIVLNEIDEDPEQEANIRAAIARDGEYIADGERWHIRRVDV